MQAGARISRVGGRLTRAVLGFLDAASLYSAGQVCSAWRQLSEQEWEARRKTTVWTLWKEDQHIKEVAVRCEWYGHARCCECGHAQLLCHFPAFNFTLCQRCAEQYLISCGLARRQYFLSASDAAALLCCAQGGKVYFIRAELTRWAAARDAERQARKRPAPEAAAIAVPWKRRQLPPPPMTPAGEDADEMGMAAVKLSEPLAHLARMVHARRRALLLFALLSLCH
eukprot:TRINITY_DN3670_c0_g1_i4.p1 TRINITY_DN3670_c0_g1~~TRINITY_DN3670_c0_g1_i4.p1  ORF type:complete len:265 (+),score=61.88 TRINITY_DN3670_c0_g1_i4:118-795(+)